MDKKVMFSVIAVIVIAAVIVGVVVANGKKSDDKSSNTKQTSTMGMNSSSSSDSSSDTTPTATNTVAIKDFAFSPVDITVKVGTTVTWTNQDSTAHTVTETDGKTGPDSGTLDQGKSYSFTYGTAGTYSYHCSFHSDMVGTVTVTE